MLIWPCEKIEFFCSSPITGKDLTLSSANASTPQCDIDVHGNCVNKLQSVAHPTTFLDTNHVASSQDFGTESQSSVFSTFNPYKYGPEILCEYPDIIEESNIQSLPGLEVNCPEQEESIRVLISEPLKKNIKIKEEVFEGEDFRKRYSRFREKKFVCDVCEHAFTLKQNVAHHIYQYHHPRKESAVTSTRTIKTRFQCTKCDKIFTKMEKAKRHFEKVHGDVVTLKEQNMFPCPDCKKVYQTFAQLRDHKRIHHENIKLFKCDDCEAEFGRSGGLRRHRQMVHDKQLHKCTYENCDHPGFKCSKALIAHIRSKHTFVRPFNCLHCEKSFVRKNDLKVHEEIHSLQSVHTCSQCNTIFKRAVYLTKHLKVCGVAKKSVRKGPNKKEK